MAEQVTPPKQPQQTTQPHKTPYAAKHAEEEQTCRGTCTAQLACHTLDKSWPAKLRGMRNDILAALHQEGFIELNKSLVSIRKSGKWILILQER